MRIVKRIAKWLGIAIGVLLLLVLIIIGGVIGALNTLAGQRYVENLANTYGGGTFRIEGLSGTVPTDLHVAHLLLLDHDGTWGELSGVALTLQATPLIHRTLVIDAVHANSISLLRPPVAAPNAKPAPPSTAPISASIPPLPIKVYLKDLSIPKVSIAKAFTGKAAIDVSISGHAQVTGENAGNAHLAIADLDGAGRYGADVALDGKTLTASLAVDEPAHGMISRVAGLPDLGALHLAAKLDGPQNAAPLTLSLSAGELTAKIDGTVDIPGEAADLAIKAHAPAMSPAPGLHWQSVDIALKTSGPFTKPNATGHVSLQGLAAQGIALKSLDADLQGNLGAVALKASLAGLVVPGLPASLLGDTPIAITAGARLDQPDEPVQVTIDHPIAHLALTGHLKPAMAADVTLDLPNLTPLAALGQQDIAGSAHITAHATRNADGTDTQATVAADIALTRALPQAMALTGGKVHLALAADMAGQTVKLSNLTLHGAHIDLGAKGSLEQASQTVALDWQLALSRLADIAPQVTGALAMTGHAAGTFKNLALQTEVKGTVGTTQGGKAVEQLSGPIDLKVDATGLPNAPKADITLTGKPAGSAADIAIEAARSADGAITARIDRMSWKSLSGQGSVALANGAKLPTGSIAIDLKRLADFRFLIAAPLSGSLALKLDAPPQKAAHLVLQGRSLAFGTNRVAAVDLTGDVTNPTTAPDINARVTLGGIDAASVRGNATVTAKGLLSALVLTLDAKLPDLQGAPASAQTRATLDLTHRRVALAALTAAWHGETLRLLGPAHIDFGKSMGVDRLRISLGTATIDAAGTVSPRLNLHVALANVTPALIKPFAPTLQVAGRIDADARLSGTMAAPGGTVTLQGRGLRETSGPAASLPPATIDAKANLAGRSARVQVQVAAGSASHITLSGTAPLSMTGELNLGINGPLDLALINPIMEASGQQVAGKLNLALRASGSAKAPQIAGSITLAGGRFQDFSQGLTLSAITAHIRAQGEQLIIDSFSAQAGSGKIGISGSVGALAPTIPLNLTVTAENADPIQSDLLTAHFDTQIHVSGAVTSGMNAAGTIRIRRADINIPSNLPPSVAVLHVIRPGDKPAPPAGPGLPINLDLTLIAPRAVFIRGDGLEAELGGRLHLGGSLAALKPSGHFDMIRGQFSLLTTTLNFTTGQVGFDGGDITDPSIDFEAVTDSGNYTCTLAVTGYASAPKITLSANPSLPQDEILSQILFKTSTTSLSPFQLAEIASALASIAGVNTGGTAGILGSVRKGLGLDQLSIGSGMGNPTGATSTTQTKNQSAPTLQAGRYVAPGVYVGAAQGTSGGSNSTAAQVQIDIARGLKLQTQVGGDSNGVGVTYQFNY
ncbi:translocation/assembly module TamB domain-containing protein [Acidisoma cellulosilytica]|uniref:Translocation/assembly module TamB domain-containing protein n=1 Tax=Acidisoma cellulosilyticum TaxID=2802395 RepID=A0A964E2D8_9PROT|nr:translocation/assembly module TamB domain-containing protein [Acidisoma cellulosilyticum]MCB8879316.1 translocation/assembly module TamB domain-containing protein [Acidisoma cellulosilyticum]